MSRLAILLFLCVLPIILILVIVYNKDKNKESLPFLLCLFLLGIISCIVTIYISKYMAYLFSFMGKSTLEMDFLNLLLHAFIGVAFVEEICKWFFVYLQGYHNEKHFDEIYDIIVFSIFVSLGFAFYENLIYVFTLGSIKTALLRAVCSIPAHTCNAIFMGYYLSIAKQYQLKNKKKKEYYNLLLSIIIPTLLHGIYDFCLISNNITFIIVFVIFIGCLYVISIRKIEEISFNNKIIIQKSIYCHICGGKLIEEKCPKCSNIKKKGNKK